MAGRLSVEVDDPVVCWQQMLAFLLGFAPAAVPPRYDLPCVYQSRRQSMTMVQQCARRNGEQVRLRPDLLPQAVFDRNGLTGFHCDGNWWYARRDGRTQRVATMDNGPDDFHSGLARGLLGGKTGFVNRHLRFVIPPRYDQAMPFEHGRAAVCNGCVAKPEGEHSVLVGGVWGSVNRAGLEVEPMRARP